jgi:hypothetical protein
VPASVTFRPGARGTPTYVVLHQNGDHRASRVEEAKWSPDAAALKAYEGRYFSSELETFYTVAMKDDKLVLGHRRFDDVTLTPGSKADSFTAGFPVTDITFERDPSGRVTALLAGNGRARGIRFERMPD